MSYLWLTSFHIVCKHLGMREKPEYLPEDSEMVTDVRIAPNDYILAPLPVACLGSENGDPATCHLRLRFPILVIKYA